MRPMLVVAVVLFATPSAAQRIELSPLVSYATSAALEPTADGVEGLDVDDGPMWGARGTYFITDRLGIEGLWTYQSTGLMMTSGSLTTETFEMTIYQTYGNVVYQLGGVESRVRPFVFGGAGATFFSATDLDDETKPTWNVGGGVKWFAHQRAGLEGRFRYKPTMLDGDDAETCGPFGFCQSALRQFDISVGAILRF